VSDESDPLVVDNTITDGKGGGIVVHHRARCDK
jgi:hypothetical protein